MNSTILTSSEQLQVINATRQGEKGLRTIMGLKNILKRK